MSTLHCIVVAAASVAFLLIIIYFLNYIQTLRQMNHLVKMAEQRYQRMLAGEFDDDPDWDRD